LSLFEDLLGAVNRGANPGADGGTAMHPGIVQALVGMLADGQLARAFSANGLPHLLESWIGSGKNLPISADQLASVLGPDCTEQLAHLAGAAPGQLLAQLSTALPQLIDGLTPQGKLPS